MFDQVDCPRKIKTFGHQIGVGCVSNLSWWIDRRSLSWSLGHVAWHRLQTVDAELRQHHQHRTPPSHLPLTHKPIVSPQLHPKLFESFTYLTMAAIFTGAPPQGGPGYSFKQTPTAVPSGERQHGFYPYETWKSMHTADTDSLQLHRQRRLYTRHLRR